MGQSRCRFDEECNDTTACGKPRSRPRRRIGWTGQARSAQHRPSLFRANESARLVQKLELFCDSLAGIGNLGNCAPGGRRVHGPVHSELRARGRLVYMRVKCVRGWARVFLLPTGKSESNCPTTPHQQHHQLLSISLLILRTHYTLFSKAYTRRDMLSCGPKTNLPSVGRRFNAVEPSRAGISGFLAC